MLVPFVFRSDHELQARDGAYGTAQWLPINRVDGEFFEHLDKGGMVL
jgi:hypothetical protein